MLGTVNSAELLGEITAGKVKQWIHTSVQQCITSLHSEGMGVPRAPKRQVVCESVAVGGGHLYQRTSFTSPIVRYGQK